MRASGRWVAVLSALLFVAAGCRQEEAGSAATPTFDAHAVLMNPDHAAWSEPAPDVFRVRLETSNGAFVIEAHRAWAPYGVDRFYTLVRTGFFDDSRFFRVRAGFIAQFGIPGDPTVTALWKDRTMPDDPVEIIIMPEFQRGVTVAYLDPPGPLDHGHPVRRQYSLARTDR